MHSVAPALQNPLRLLFAVRFWLNGIPRRWSFLAGSPYEPPSVCSILQWDILGRPPEGIFKIHLESKATSHLHTHAHTYL